MELKLFLEDFGFDVMDMSMEEIEIVYEDYKSLIFGE